MKVKRLKLSKLSKIVNNQQVCHNFGINLMESKSKFTGSQKKDALSMAQGLFESKVSIHRPPSTAQKATYTTVRSGATRPVHTTRYGKTREKSRRTECINVQQPTHHPVWKPFSSERSLSKDKNKQTNIKKSYSTVNSVSNTTNQDRDPDLARLPRGVEILEPWINEEFCEEWIGVNAGANCFIMIQPCDFDHPVECLPPLQKADEPLLERPIEEVKKYVAPKILHNYNYPQKENQYQCQHEQKQDAKVDPRRTTQRLRTSEIIKQEIEDLERLLQGYGNPNSSSIVNRYQYEITKLKEMVVETLREYHIDEDLPQEKLETSVIQGDLFEFIARHEEVITAIKEKRDACLKELAKLEQELCGNRRTEP